MIEWHDAEQSEPRPPLYEPVWLYHAIGIGAGDQPIGAVALAVLGRDGTWTSATASAPQAEYPRPLAWARLEEPAKPRRVPAQWEAGDE